MVNFKKMPKKILLYRVPNCLRQRQGDLGKVKVWRRIEDDAQAIFSQLSLFLNCQSFL